MANKILSDLELAIERAKIEADGSNYHQLPEAFTGARAVLTVNGRKIGAAMEVSWSVAIDYEEVRTIDSYMPWELVPGQAKVKMSMRRIITPDRSLAGDGLFTTITSVLHTPYASVELRDRLGNLVFFAKGSFTDIQGQVSNGQMGVASLSFIGYYWRENVKQEFDPQPADNSVMGKIKTTNSLYGRIKGGL